MRRLTAVPFVLVLAALACALPGAPIPTPTPSGPTSDAVGTAVAATLTAVVPTLTAPPTPTAVPPSETPAPTPLAPQFACFAAYAESGQVYCVSADGTPLQIGAAEGGEISDVRISPDGALVAFRVQQPNFLAQLWVAQADGSGQRPLVGQAQLPSSDPNLANSPLLYEWRAGGHTLFFNTSFIPLSGEVGPGEYVNDDLWTADADTGRVTNLLGSRSGGLFSLSPDGRYVALSRPQSIDLMRTDGTDYRPGLITFPFILTYSEYAYKPPVTWSPDGAFFSVAIPTEDPLGVDAGVAFHRVSVGGTVQRLGTRPGNFVFGGDPRPEFSPDGQHVVYGMVDQATNTPVLHLVTADGARDTLLAQGEGVGALGWTPDSRYYVIAESPGRWSAVGTDGSAQPILSGVEASRGLRWVDAGSFVFHGQMAGTWGLWYQAFAGTQVLLAGVGPNVVFDAGP